MELAPMIYAGCKVYLEGENEKEAAIVFARNLQEAQKRNFELKNSLMEYKISELVTKTK